MQPDRDRAFGWRYAVTVRPWQRPRSYADGFWHGFGWGCAACTVVLVWGMWWLG